MSEILSRGQQNVVRFCRRYLLAYVKPNLLLNVLKYFFLCDVGLKRHVQSVSGGGGEGASSNVWTIFLT